MRSSKCLLCLSLVVAVAFVFTQALPTEAQIAGMPKLYGEFKMPEVGAYASYKVINTKNKAERITKLAIVGKEKSKKGEDLYWYEVKETDPKTGVVNTVKMLISGNPQEIGTIHQMIIKSGKDPATELPQEILGMLNQTPPQKTKVEEPKSKKLGTEKVKIKKKTFECIHLRYSFKDKTTAEVWTNTKVPFGVVKSTSPEMTMELLEYGADAVSAIKEKPEVLEMPEKK